MRLSRIEIENFKGIGTAQVIDLKPITLLCGEQPSLPTLCPLREAVRLMATAGVEQRGAIFTRREVVEFILDLVGYTTDKPLHTTRLLEPSFGGGDFLLAAVERLLSASSVYCADTVAGLSHAIRAVEVHQATFNATRARLQALLQEHGFDEPDADTLCSAWLTSDDFLLTEIDGSFNYVIGNPPYVRQELLSDVLIGEYRRRYATVYDRADIYIPFIERSLQLLSERGAVGFICADRWMKNRYGGPLRRLIADRYHLRAYIDMVDTPAFHSDVIAYPAIFVIANERGNVTRLAKRPEIETVNLSELARQITRTTTPDATVTEVSVVTAGDAPWLVEGFDQLGLVRQLEARFPTLEEAGCKVGIGVATGADSAFIGSFAELDVEEDRKLPLAMTRDILSGSLEWRGLGVVNPFADEGGLVCLEQYPRLKRYLEARRPEIAGRHVAKKTPANWYRTIDRIYPALVGKPKLLIPDIKGDAQIVYDPGTCYPHHNLYHITSDDWDLRALQAVLTSGIAHLFVAAYSTKMRGGYLRFQAQYLRRIRLPLWKDVGPELRNTLRLAAEQGDQAACNAAVAELYGLSPEDCALLTSTPGTG